MWLARYAGFHRPDSHISSGGLGTMGYGLPAAMGAALGRPDKESWAIVGDGGLQMTSQEFMTAAADHIPVKVALLDNGKLGMIRQWQEIIYAQAGRLGVCPALAAGLEPDHDVDARVVQVLGVGVPLAAVADDGHGLAGERRRVGVVVVVHACGHPVTPR